MGSFEDVGCNTGLNLGLGFSTTSTAVPTPSKPNSSSGGGMNQTAATETKLTLSLSGGHRDEINHNRSQNQNQNQNHHHQLLMYRQVSPQSHGSAVSSYSSGRVKRERDQSSTDDQDVEVERMVSSRVSDEDEDGGVNARKKLRLTKEQSALLEESFKQHSTLNPKQKQALARQLNLRPRQVEVWFQNRRARTKLKQTEVDCEFLKKCCETLTDENRRLQKEVQELKALKLAQPFYMHMPAATLTMCPSCERIGGGGDGSSKVPFPMVAKPGHCFNPFTNPSAAC